MKTVKAVVITMRPYQWVKNLVFFTALIFGGRLADVHDVATMLGGFLLFSLLSSSVYLLNDAKDAELDRKNPEKRKRPVAAGDLSPTAAVAWSVVLTLGVLLVAFGLPWLDPEVRGFGFGICLLVYYVQNLLYTWVFKQQAVLDVISISFGFVLRILAGGFLIGVEISPWALICTFFLSLFLGLGKRRHELHLDGGETGHRPALKDYHPQLVDQMLTVVLAATVVTYAIYTVSDHVMGTNQAEGEMGAVYLHYSLVFVVYGLFRYLYLIHRHREGGDPTRTLVSDPPMLITIFLWGLTVVGALYFFNGLTP